MSKFFKLTPAYFEGTGAPPEGMGAAPGGNSPEIGPKAGVDAAVGITVANGFGFSGGVVLLATAVGLINGMGLIVGLCTGGLGEGRGVAVNVDPTGLDFSSAFDAMSAVRTPVGLPTAVVLGEGLV